jgi:hypothetical protein
MATGTKDIKPFDVADLMADDTTEVPLVNFKTGEEIEGLTVTLYGPDSEVHKSARNKLVQRGADYRARNRGKDMPPEESDRHYRSFVVACTKSINGLVFKGKAITDPAEAYSLPGCGWIFEQVAIALGDRANFIKG